jgi:hypothetical protein
VLEDNVADEKRFVVEAVREHKRDPQGEYVYLVSWRGFSEEHDSWEPAANFDDGSTLTNYWRKHRKRKKSLGVKKRKRHKVAL